MSKYDKIETAAELIAEVAAHGLSMAQEDICRAQDIFGNSPIGELARLANDIGRNNEKGEPDPEGSWSSGRKGTQETFYSIAFSIWHWQQATAFYNEHTNPAMKQAKKAAEEVRSLRERVLSGNDMNDVSQLLASKVIELGKEVSNAAERIVEAAGQPESAAFQNAVKDHRAAKADLEHYTALLSRINAAAKAGE